MKFFAVALALLTYTNIVLAAPAEEGKVIEAVSAAETKYQTSILDNSFVIQGVCPPWNTHSCNNPAYPLCCIAVYPPTCCPVGARSCSADGKTCYL